MLKPFDTARRYLQIPFKKSFGSLRPKCYRKLGLATAIVIALSIALIFLGPTRINPTNTEWMVGDFLQVQFGWEFYRLDTKFGYLPPATSETMSPVPINLAMYDALPLVSFVLRHFASFLPFDFQFIGAYLTFSVILQAIFAFLLFNECASRYHPPVSTYVFSAIATVFVAASPVLLWRWRGHTALSSQWLIIAAFWLLLRSERTSSLGNTIRFSVLFFLAGGLSPYLLSMIGIVFMGLLAKEWHAGRANWRHVIASIVVTLASGLLALTIFGFILIGTGGALPVAGYGYYSAHPLALLYPIEGKATFIPELPIGIGTGQYEGYGYLGMGVILMFLLGLGMAVRKGCLWSSNIVAFLVIGLAAYGLALSPRITWPAFLADAFVVDLIMRTLEVFRSAGRFIWLLHYGIIIAASLLLAKWLTSRWLAAAMAGFLIIQLVDLAPTYSQFAEVIRRPATRLQGHIWELAPDHRKLIIVPPYQCNPAGTPGGPFGFEYLAPLHFGQRLATNSSYVGRISRNQVAYHCIEFLSNFHKSDVERDAAYLFSLTSFEEKGRHLTKTHNCELAQKMVICRIGNPGLAPALSEYYRLRTVVDTSRISSRGSNFSALQFGWHQTKDGWRMAGEAAGIEVVSGFRDGTLTEMRLSVEGDRAAILPPKFLQVYVAGAYVGHLTVSGSQPIESSFDISPGLSRKGDRFRVTLLDSGGGPGAVKLDSIEFREGAKESRFDAFHIEFSRRINDRALLVRNWAPLEDRLVWNDGLTAALRVPRPTGKEAFGVTFDVALPVLPAGRSGRHHKVMAERVEVSVEGTTVFGGRLKDGDSKLSFTVPPSRSGLPYAELEFRFPDAVAMEERPNSWDRRRIAVGVKSVLVHSCKLVSCREN